MSIFAVTYLSVIVEPGDVSAVVSGDLRMLRLGTLKVYHRYLRRSDGLEILYDAHENCNFKFLFQDIYRIPHARYLCLEL